MELYEKENDFEDTPGPLETLADSSCIMEQKTEREVEELQVSLYFLSTSRSFLKMKHKPCVYFFNGWAWKR